VLGLLSRAFASLYREGRADGLAGVACAGGGAAAAGVSKGSSDDWIRICYITSCGVGGCHPLLKIQSSVTDVSSYIAFYSS